jgi:hypothetical protein
MSPKYKEIERMRGKPLKDILIEEYQKHGEQIAVAKSLGVSQPTLSTWLRFQGLREHKILVEHKI